MRRINLTIFLCLLSSISCLLAQTTYNNRPAFEGDLNPGTIITDDYSGYIGGPYTDAQMSAFFGETDYTTTREFDDNRTTGGIYCSGDTCQGSFQLSFATTSITENGQGVCGVGFDYIIDPFVPYSAYVTFGDGTMQDYILPAVAGFFGVTSEDLIVSIHVGFGGGAPTVGDTDISMDNLTIGQCLDDAGGVPAIPTLSQWGLYLFFLTFTTLGLVLIYQKQVVLVPVNREPGKSFQSAFKFLPFNLKSFKRIIPVSLVYVLLGCIVIQMGWQTLTLLDMTGLIVSSLIFTYLLHLFLLIRKG